MKETAVKRVAYVHDTAVYGGVEVFLLALMRHLDPNRYQPVVIIPGYTDVYRASPPRLIEQVEKMGVPILRLPKTQGKSPVAMARELLTIRKLFRQHQIDVMHTHTCRPTGARKATLGAWLAGTPARLRTEHGPPLGVTRFTPLIVKPLDWTTHFISTVSDATSQDQLKMVHRNPRKLYRSYGGIELSRFNPDHNVREAKIKIGLEPDVPVVGAVGRLAWEKGHKHLINAARYILDNYGPVNFIVVGEGPLEQKLKQQVVDMNLSERFQFVGYQPDLNAYMEAMDIGVMPSEMEGLGLAALEFMALRKPLVLSTQPCFREVIVHGESGLISSLEGHELADNILKLLNDPELAARMGQAALQRVRAEFTVQRLADDMMNLYDRILQGKHERKIIPVAVKSFGSND